MELKAGQRVGEYILVEPLGEGGGGTVWRGRHALLRSNVAALKFPHDDSLLAWLRREGMIQSQLASDSIVKVLGGDLEGSTPYIALELVEGGDLRSALKDGPLEPDRARTIARGILEALDVAHSAGIVHGDLKPENVLLPETGGIKLTDFGLAHGYLEGELQHSLASSRPKVAGTLRYVPPELLESGKPSPKTDLYSFGVVLFELLVGRVPQGLEGPADHGVEAPDLERLFGSCYVPEARRLPDARAALSLLARQLEPEAEQALERLANAHRDTATGRLIAKRRRREAATPGFLARLFGWDRQVEAEATPAPAAAAAPSAATPPATPPPVERAPSRPAPRPGSSAEALRGFRGRFIAVATSKTERGSWVWRRVDDQLRKDADAEILAFDMSGCPEVEDSDLKALTTMTALTNLDLSECSPITDAGLRYLAELSALTYLSLRGCELITDAGLKHLRSLKELNTLDLTGCGRIKDPGIRSLRPLSSLSFLFLDGCRHVTDAAIEDLKGHAPLQWVSH
jgi:serine/threonine protein kinase